MFQALHKRLSNDERGFTLIELMVVVLIIAILIAIAVPTFLGARERAQDRAAQSDLRTGLVAAKVFYTDGETFDATATQLEAIEPNIDWVKPAAAGQGQGVVGYTNIAVGGDDALLVAESQSGTWFCIYENETAGTTYGTGAAFADVDTAADCALDSW